MIDVLLLVAGDLQAGARWQFYHPLFKPHTVNRSACKGAMRTFGSSNNSTLGNGARAPSGQQPQRRLNETA